MHTHRPLTQYSRWFSFILTYGQPLFFVVRPDHTAAPYTLPAGGCNYLRWVNHSPLLYRLIATPRSVLTTEIIVHLWLRTGERPCLLRRERKQPTSGINNIAIGQLETCILTKMQKMKKVTKQVIDFISFLPIYRGAILNCKLKSEK